MNILKCFVAILSCIHAIPISIDFLYLDNSYADIKSNIRGSLTIDNLNNVSVGIGSFSIQAHNVTDRDYTYETIVIPYIGCTDRMCGNNNYNTLTSSHINAIFTETYRCFWNRNQFYNCEEALLSIACLLNYNSELHNNIVAKCDVKINDNIYKNLISDKVYLGDSIIS